MRIPFAIQRALVAGLLIAAVLPAPVAAAATDSDGDGLPNTFERYRSRTNPTSKDTEGDGLSDAREDPDGDRLTNRDEYLSETHPQKVDSDGDGRTDDLEDPDGDGLWNWSEPRAVVHPRKPTPMATVSRMRRRIATRTA